MLFCILTKTTSWHNSKGTKTIKHLIFQPILKAQMTRNIITLVFLLPLASAAAAQQRTTAGRWISPSLFRPTAAAEAPWTSFLTFILLFTGILGTVTVNKRILLSLLIVLNHHSTNSSRALFRPTCDSHCQEEILLSDLFLTASPRQSHCPLKEWISIDIDLMGSFTSTSSYTAHWGHIWNSSNQQQRKCKWQITNGKLQMAWWSRLCLTLMRVVWLLSNSTSLVAYHYIKVLKLNVYTPENLTLFFLLYFVAGPALCRKYNTPPDAKSCLFQYFSKWPKKKIPSDRCNANCVSQLPFLSSFLLEAAQGMRHTLPNW